MPIADTGSVTFTFVVAIIIKIGLASLGVKCRLCSKKDVSQIKLLRILETALMDI